MAKGGRVIVELESDSYDEFIALSSDSEDDGGEFGGNLEEFVGYESDFEELVGYESDFEELVGYESDFEEFVGYESDFEFDDSEFEEEEEIRAKSSKKGRKKSEKKQTKARRKVSDSYEDVDIKSVPNKNRRKQSRKDEDEESVSFSKRIKGYRKEKASRSPVKIKRTRKNTKSKVSRRKKPTVPKNKKEKKSTKKRGRGGERNSPKEPATKRRRRSGQINQTEILKPNIEPIKCYQAPSKKRNLKATVTILAFDLETTGFNTPAERIVEFAARNLIGGRCSTFQTLIDPQKIIRNSDIHGITNSMIKQAKAPRMEDVIPRLFEWVELQEPDKPVIWLAHNGNTFDFSFLIREMNRCGFDVPDRWRFFDTLPLARRLVDSNGMVLKKHKVTDLCEFFGIVIEEAAHTAMGDVNRLSYIFQHTTIRLKFTVSDLIKESLTASDIKWKPSK